MSNIELQPATEKVGGGWSARLAAVVASGLVLSVIWFGLSGRSDVPPAPSSAPSPVAAASPSPTATPAPTRPEPTPRMAPLPVYRTLKLGDDAFAVTAWIHDRFYTSVLHETEPGHLQAAMRVPFTSSDVPAQLGIIQLWTRDERPNFERIVEHELRAGWLVPAKEPYPVLSDDVAGLLASQRAPRLVRQGYALEVRAQAFEVYSHVIVDVWLKAEVVHEPLPPAPMLKAVLHNDERLISVVGLGGRPPGVMTGHVILHERYGARPTLSLVHSPADSDADEVIASLPLEMKLLRRGYPEQFRGTFMLAEGDDRLTDWQYQITPQGAGLGVLLLVQVEQRRPVRLPTASERLIEITEGWRDYGQRDAATPKWSCWSHGEVC